MFCGELLIENKASSLNYSAALPEKSKNLRNPVFIKVDEIFITAALRWMGIFVKTEEIEDYVFGS